MYPGLDITNKICLITGGTSGIGRAIALGFAQAGAKVVAGSTNPDKVAAIKNELNAVGGEHDATPLNVTDEASVQAAVDFTLARFGRLDAVVNAAGIIKKVPSLDMPVAEFRKIIDINLTGTFIVNQAAARVMRNQTPNAQRGGGRARLHRQHRLPQLLH